MKKSRKELEKEELFSFEAAEEIFPPEGKKLFSSAHRERFGTKVKKSQKNFESEKTQENKS
ncbi:MAG: hypothetical protein Q4D20_01280 [Clostridia bacterium]|nr:hypothetical protein [Clostridia bacterium]